MSSRGKVWLVGLMIVASLGLSIAREPAGRDLIVPSGLLALGLIALIAELLNARAIARRPGRSEPPPGALPADGVVELAPMLWVEGIPLLEDPRWRRFVRLKAGPFSLSRQAPLIAEDPALLGRVALISVFVGCDGRSWSGAEIEQAHRSLMDVGSWIEREARRWEAPVNIALAETYFLVDDPADEPVEVAFSPEGDDVGPMEANASAKAIAAASRAASVLGFTDIVGLLREINPRVESDAQIWIFHLRRSGRSHAIPASEGEISGVGLAICYSRESSFPEPLRGRGRVDPTTVAHELLHLFGATDKYGSSLRGFPPHSVSAREIMRLSYNALGRMTIDSLTAREIGWLASPGPDPSHKKTAHDHEGQGGR